MAINWDEAPEGTTHAADWGKGPRWRKVTDHTVFVWHDEWQDMECDPKAWLAEYDDVVTAKPVAPPIVVINGVEVNWAEAPADATHVAIVHGEFKGWRKIAEGQVYGYEEGEWSARVVTSVARYLEVNKGLVFERPGAGFVAPVVKKEQVVAAKAEPKRQVGWWS